jgi:hypothetical protein
MHIFVDESGNSGRNIFDGSETFLLGSLMTVEDIEEPLKAVIRPILQQEGLLRLHASDLGEKLVAEIGADILQVLDSLGPWKFHVAEIHKPFIAPTKFVDVLFDAGENEAVEWHWYNHDYYRQTLCAVIDDAMRPKSALAFWESFLKDDITGILDVARTVWTYVLRHEARDDVRNVIRAAFSYAYANPDAFTLMATSREVGYQNHSPNVIAFTVLFPQIHAFARKTGSKPIALVHDNQSEFKKTLHEVYQTFGKMDLRDRPDGLIPRADLVDYDLANFTMPRSGDSYALQATDLLLWAKQRKAQTVQLKEFARSLNSRTEMFYFGRAMTNSIIALGEPAGSFR